LLTNVVKLLVEVSEHISVALSGSSKSYNEGLQSSHYQSADITMQHD